MVETKFEEKKNEAWKGAGANCQRRAFLFNEGCFPRTNMQGWRNYAAVRSAALYMRYGDWAPGAGGDPIHSEHPTLP